MARIQQQVSDEAFICNVSPAQYSKQLLRVTERDGEIHNTIDYVLPPADPETGFSVLRIESSHQRILDPSVTEAHEYRLVDIDAKVEAESLVELWRQQIGVGAGGHPGVGIIAGKRPTEDEIQYLRGAHEIWCRELIGQADEFWADPQRRRNVTTTHRDAAAFLGIVHSTEHPWVSQATANSSKQCLACRERIDMQALVCSKCGRDLIAFAVEHDIEAAIIRSVDPIIAPLVTKKRQVLAREKGKEEAA